MRFICFKKIFYQKYSDFILFIYLNQVFIISARNINELINIKEKKKKCGM